MTRRLRRGAPLLLLLLLALPRVGYAADDIFVQIAGIQGDATDSGHQNWIQAYALGNSVTATTSPVGQRMGTEFSDLSVLKKIDRASPALFLSAARAHVFQTVKIDFVRSGDTRFVYFKMELREAQVTGVRTNANLADDSITEFVTLSYVEIAWEYIPQNSDGSAGAPVKGCWNRAEGTSC